MDEQKNTKWRERIGNIKFTMIEILIGLVGLVVVFAVIGGVCSLLELISPRKEITFEQKLESVMDNYGMDKREVINILLEVDEKKRDYVISKLFEFGFEDTGYDQDWYCDQMLEYITDHRGYEFIIDRVWDYLR